MQPALKEDVATHLKDSPTRRVGWRYAPTLALLALFAALSVGLHAPANAAAQATITGSPAVGAEGLPDGRGYELVSPPTAEKVGGTGIVLPLINTYQEYSPLQASPEGNSVTYLAEDFYNPNVGAPNQYLSTRGATGWATVSESVALAPPANLPEFDANSDAVGYSSDLSHFVRISRQKLTQEDLPAGYRLEGDGLPARYPDLWVFNAETKVAQPLVTVTPPNRGPGEFIIEFVGSSKDFSRIFFQANDVLAPGAEYSEESERTFNLYEWHDGTLRTVNTLEGGVTAPHSSFGSPSEELYSNFTNVVSPNGERVVWSDLGTGALYLSELGHSPVQIDQAETEAGAAGASGGGSYLTASTDDSRIFFDDPHQLTNDSTAAEGAPDLYEYNVETHKLKDLTVDSTPEGHASVLGVAGVSQDGSYVYFVAEGVLASGAAAGEPNLYVAHEGTLELIATLSPEDADDHTLYADRDGRFGDWSGFAGIRTSDVTPGGHLVAFQSVNSLTGYKNEGVTEVYVYNALTNQLHCASCNHSGAKPLGLSALPATNFTTDPPRWLSETEGGGERLFFDSEDALVPWDTNHQMDVYEYENGIVSLISNGTSPYESGLATASESGNDVFFTTSDQLVGQDQDELVDLYDARVGGGFSEAPRSAPCLEVDSCRGSGQAVAPALGAPSSAQLQGAGNLAPPAPVVVPRKKTAAQLHATELDEALKLCKAKRNKRRRAACEATARRRYGPAKKPGKARKGHKR